MADPYRPNPAPPISALESAFHAAMELPSEEREGFAAVRLADDPVLLQSLLQLIRADEANSDGRLSPLPLDELGEEIPATIGDYVVQRHIAAGGVGSVYDAVHSGTGRRAALKLLRAGFLTAKQKVRFQVEAELLGKLNHPGIAHLYEAGIAEVTYPPGGSPPARRPFIAMEFVEGRVIGDFVKDRGLTVRERAELVRDAARAVSHAHARGIIHRDLKPANLLVTPAGQVKVVDFGVARLVESDTSEPSAPLTVDGVLLGTPSFMSPEQFAGRSVEVDLPADVYGLGATLYFLLAGRPPVSATAVLSASSAASLLARPVPELRTLARDVDPDLAAVVHRALERDLRRRYPDGAALAEDLDRWLAGLPTLARPLGPAGRILKYVRRNRLRSAGLVVLAAAVAATAVQYVRAERAYARERAALADQTAIVDFVNDLLVRVSPDSPNALNPAARFAEIVGQADRDVASLSARPAVQARVRVTLAKINLSLGNLAAAQDDAVAAIRAFDRLGADSFPKIEAKEILAQAYKERGQLADATRERSEILNWRRARQGIEHPDALWAEAEAFVAGVEGAVRTPARDSPIISVGKMVALRYQRGPAWTRADEEHLIRCRELLAIVLLEFDDQLLLAGDNLPLAIDEATRLYGPDHPVTLRLSKIDGVSQYRIGNFAAAQPILLRVRDRLAARVGETHQTVLHIDVILADITAELGDPATALEMHRRASERLLAALGPRQYQVVESRQKIAADLRLLGRLDEADALLRQCLADYANVDGPTRYIVRSCWHQVGLLRLSQGRLAEAADALFTRAGEACETAPQVTWITPEVATWFTDYAEVLAKLGQHGRAVLYAGASYRSLLKSVGPDAGHTRRAKNVLDNLLR